MVCNGRPHHQARSLHPEPWAAAPPRCTPACRSALLPLALAAARAQVVRLSSQDVPTAYAYELEAATIVQSSQVRVCACVCGCARVRRGCVLSPACARAPVPSSCCVHLLLCVHVVRARPSADCWPLLLLLRRWWRQWRRPWAPRGQWPWLKRGTGRGAALRCRALGGRWAGRSVVRKRRTFTCCVVQRCSACSACASGRWWCWSWQLFVVA